MTQALDLSFLTQLASHARLTRLPVAPALCGRNHIMTIAVKRAAFGVAHKTVKIKIIFYYGARL